MLKEIIIRKYTDSQGVDSLFGHIIVDENSNFDGVLDGGDYLVSGSLADGIKMTCCAPSELDKLYISSKEGNCYEGEVDVNIGEDKIPFSNFTVAVYTCDQNLICFVNDKISALKEANTEKALIKKYSHN